MTKRQLLYLAILAISSVFALSVAWEFVFEDLFWSSYMLDHEEESKAERWEFIITSTVFSEVASPVWTVLRVC
jgi:hypothetical protein